MMAAADIWAQSLDGRALSLLAPTAREVDFREIARTLARLTRYAGAACVPVSVALHTLIACDAAEPDIRPWVLLHDAHEARIGEITTPYRRALVAEVRTQAGSLLAAYVEEAMAAIEARHDAAIHDAAGLPLPTPEQRAAIRRADLVALVTERRDFLAAPPKPWAPEIEATPPLDASYADLAMQCPDLVARLLLDRFHAHLPALAEASARAPRAPD